VALRLGSGDHQRFTVEPLLALRRAVTSLSLSNRALETLRVDAVVVGLAKGPNGPVLVGDAAVEKAMGGKLAATLAALGASGAEGEVTRLATLGRLGAPVLVAVGLGPVSRNGYAAETVRRGVGAATRSLAGTGKVATGLASVASTDGLRAAAEGALLGAYVFDRYRFASRDGHKPPVAAVTLVHADTGAAAKAVLRRAETVVAGVAQVRDLVNASPSDLFPQAFAALAVDAARAAGVEVTVLDEKVLRKGGYGGITGVGQGSSHPPRLVRVAHTHPKATRTVALVGKGITFDSGGLSIKPAAAMEWMKSDMGGAAAVLATVNVAARLGLAVNVVGYAPMCENMPSGAAIRPSDVLTMYGGKRVEVLNTDAEGRLVLADAMVRASEDKPDYLIDVATLTGAQLVALGAHTAAVMANDDLLRGRVIEASDRAGEQMWPMPLPPELRRSLDSDVADIANMGDRYGGMLVAGLFLQDFVPDGLPWAHLDIAGPAFNQGSAYGYTPKGGTGNAVRTLVELLEDIAASS
jgi:leucyl aminopeptidase